MKDRPLIDKGLSFIVGGLHGIVNDKSMRPKGEFGYSEDYEKCIINYIKYGGAIRFNKARHINKLYTNKGGLQDHRTTDSMIEDREKMVEAYPQYCRLKKESKSKYPEIKIINKPYTIENHLLANFKNMGWMENTSRPNVSGVNPKYDVRPKNRAGNPCYSYTLGFIKLRCAKSDDLVISALTKRFDFLYGLLKRYIHKIDPTFKFTGITLNKNICCLPHTDKYNQSKSYIVALGDYTGGHLFIEDEDKKVVKHNINNKPLLFSGKNTHWNDATIGERFSMIFYCSCSPSAVENFWKPPPHLP